MIIKKFVEKDSRSAMAKVRDEFGADAVVLSSRSVDDSFEMVAAANYDEYDIVRELENAEQSKKETQDALKQEEPIAAAPENQAERPPAKPIAPLQAVPESVAVQEQGADKDADKDSAPTLVTLQTELASLRALLQKELPKLSRRSKTRSGPGGRQRKKSVVRSTIQSRLARLGFSKSLSNQLIEKVNPQDELDSAWELVTRSLTGKIQQSEEKLLEDGGIAAFIGPAGVGKTTTIAKLAVSHLMKYGRGEVGLITTGGMKDQPNDRLIKFARAMDIPCAEAKTATHLKDAINEFSSKKLVLIDTAGMDRNDLRLTMQLAEFRLATDRIENYLVIDADTEGAALEKTINAFSRYCPVGVVVTKVDISKRLGGIIEVLAKKKLPLSYISNGTRIPKDLHIGGAKDLVRRALILMQDLSVSGASDGKGSTRRTSDKGASRRKISDSSHLTASIPPQRRKQQARTSQLAAG